MKSQLSNYKIYLFLTIMLLATSVLHAVSADFFGTNTQTGEDNLRSQISSSNPSAEFFEYHFIAAEKPNPVTVVGTDGTPIYVKISRGNNVNDYSYPVGHDDDTTYFMDGWSVSVPTSDSGWDEAVAEGVKFEFFLANLVNIFAEVIASSENVTAVGPENKFFNFSNLLPSKASFVIRFFVILKRIPCFLISDLNSSICLTDKP